MKTKNFKFRLLLVIAFVSVSFTTSIFGQVPEKMSYQAVVRNASNELIVNKQIGVFVIVQKTTSATLPMTYYQEKHTANTNVNGLLTLELGGGTPSYPYHALSFSQIPWGEGSFYVKILIDPAGGTNYTITTESQLLSVPYAMYAKKAGESATTSVVGEIKYWNGTAWITVPPSLDNKYLTLEKGVPTWKDYVLSGSTIGEMKYWNGTVWVSVPPSLDNKYLTVEDGVPTWKDFKLYEYPLGYLNCCFYNLHRQ